MSAQPVETGRMPPPAVADLNFAAFLLFESDAELDEAAILGTLARRAADFGAEFETSDATEQRLRTRGVTGTFHRTPERVPLHLRFSTVWLTVTVSSRPGDRAFWQGFVDPAIWPDAFESIGRERAHVAIVERGDAEGAEGPDAAYDRALATTVAAHAITMLADPLAVLWHPARNALSPEHFVRAVRPLAEQRSPLELWTSLRPMPGSNGNAGVATEGLLPLIGREIEVPPSLAKPLAMARIALDLARYLLDEGGCVADGAMFGGRVRVRKCLSNFRPGTPALQLCLEETAG